MTATPASNNSPSILGFSIPSLLTHLGWENIDLLKMDIEGAEREVFNAKPQWLENVRVLMIEIHDELAPGAMDAVQGATRAFGFECSQCGEAWWFTRRDR